MSSHHRRQDPRRNSEAMVYDQLGSIPDGSRGPTSTGRAWPKVMVLADAQALTKWMAPMPEVRS